MSHKSHSILCPAGLVALAWLGDEYTSPILSLIYAFVELHRADNIVFVKIPVETTHLKLLTLPHKAYPASPAREALFSI